MRTLEEIVAALPKLSHEEMGLLESSLCELRETNITNEPVFTGKDAIQWWRRMTHLHPEEAEAFAHDIEAGRRELNQHPRVRF